jgi:hypothetical protein
MENFSQFTKKFVKNSKKDYAYPEELLYKNYGLFVTPEPEQSAGSE